MRRYLAGRALQALIVVFLVTTISFFLVHLAPGDPFSEIAENGRVSPEVSARWRAAYGLDKPLGEQYVRYLWRVAHGDLGPSIALGEPVSRALGRAIPNTLQLMSIALALSFALGIAAGTWQSARRGRLADRALGSTALVFYSMPDFWLATVMLLVFAYRIPLFPVGGMLDPVMYPYMGTVGRVADRLKHAVLPALTLALLTAASIARYHRAAMLDVVAEDFVRTARAKGLTERAVIGRHVLRNALLPVITLVGLSLPALLGGAVFVEKVFSWPGMGLLVVSAIGTRDYAVVVAGVLAGSVMVAIGSFVADALYAVADPRVRGHG